MTKFEILEAKEAIDKVITKARVHLYKPIQVAEILYKYRMKHQIDLLELESYRTISRRWRDEVCLKFLGRTSTSSARYQDDVFNENAVPPRILNILGEVNNQRNGIVEAYIYKKFQDKRFQMVSALDYCLESTVQTFELVKFLDLFWNEPGLRRSIDKIYEIVVYSLFSAIVKELNVNIKVSVDKSKLSLLEEFDDFSKAVIGITLDQLDINHPACINRVGVTNAADRGLDMWTNFGLAIQIKHLALTEDLAEEIVGSVSSDRIVIVCKDAEQKIILSLLNQLGWKSKIQSIVTEKKLIDWYERAFKGKFSDILGDKILNFIINEIVVEFPTADDVEFKEFCSQRGYNEIDDLINWI